MLAASSRAGRPGTASGVLRYEREFGSKPQNSHSYSLETASKQWVSAPNPSQKDPRILRSHLQKDPSLVAVPIRSPSGGASKHNGNRCDGPQGPLSHLLSCGAEDVLLRLPSTHGDRPGHTRGLQAPLGLQHR